jgi:hypothetical protein
MRKTKTIFILIGLLICLAVVSCAGLKGKNMSDIDPVWQPDNEDGTYKNPIIYADYSDPDVIRVGDDFYMTASSFNCVPGLPILHSKDLVNWKLIGHAIQHLKTNVSICRNTATGSGRRLYAITTAGSGFSSETPMPVFL